MKKKTIRFEYFLLNEMLYDSVNNNVTPVAVNLDEVLTELQQMPIMTRKIDIINGEAIILVSISYKNRQRGQSRYNYWHLQFVRVRETMLPSIIDENGICREVVLRNNENLAEFTNVLYDNNNNVMLIQRSLEGVSPRYVSDFFSEFSNNQIQPIVILAPSDLQLFVDGSLIKRVSFSAASCINSTNPSVSQVAEASRGMGANYFDATLRLGMTARDSSMNLESVRGLLRSLLGNADVKKLNVSAKLPGEHSKVESYDLFEQRHDEKVPFSFSREHPITNNRIFMEMENKYFDSLGSTNLYIRRPENE
ncbi:DUF6731 family protein [Phascolarctobacterium faecium]|uniref:DUF6731 family protein n=1 Tax=Phascolarctobacterium faecium TaxID=33025 RepID=UPI00242D8EC8|nr:DUF6731 family protein [Phascolarctobacterium faecium]